MDEKTPEQLTEEKHSQANINAKILASKEGKEVVKAMQSQQKFYKDNQYQADASKFAGDKVKAEKQTNHKTLAVNEGEKLQKNQTKLTDRDPKEIKNSLPAKVNTNSTRENYIAPGAEKIFTKNFHPAPEKQQTGKEITSAEKQKALFTGKEKTVKEQVQQIAHKTKQKEKGKGIER